MNVMLTRCRMGMVIVSNELFLKNVGYSTLLGQIAQHWENETSRAGVPFQWVTGSEIMNQSVHLSVVKGENMSIQECSLLAQAGLVADPSLSYQHQIQNRFDVRDLFPKHNSPKNSDSPPDLSSTFPALTPAPALLSNTAGPLPVSMPLKTTRNQTDSPNWATIAKTSKQRGQSQHTSDILAYPTTIPFSKQPKLSHKAASGGARGPIRVLRIVGQSKSPSVPLKTIADNQRTSHVTEAEVPKKGKNKKGRGKTW